MRYFNNFISNKTSLILMISILFLSSTLSAMFGALFYDRIAYAGRSVIGNYFDNIAAKTITIMDDNKKPRGQIVVGENGIISFGLLDQHHKTRLEIKASNDFSSLELYDENGINRLFAGIDSSGYGGIHLRGDDGSVFTAGTQKGTPVMLALTDKNKRVRHSFNFNNKKTSYFMTGPSGDDANLIFMEKDGTRGFSLTRRHSGGPIAVLGMNGDKPSLVMHDGDKSGLAVGYSASGEAGMLINQDGRPIWKAGSPDIRTAAPDIVDLIK